MTLVTEEQWDQFQQRFPDASFYQTSAWGRLKSQFGWEKPEYFCTDSAAALMLIKKLPLGIRFGYIPKGPLGSDWQQLWPEIDELCRDKGIAFLKVEPDVYEPVTEDFYHDMKGFSLSENYIQPLNSMYVDLTGTEKDWDSRLSRTVRQYLKRALRNGLVIKESEDVKALHHLIEITANRHEFVYRSLEYYEKAYDTFVRHGQGVMLCVEYNEIPLSCFLLYGNGSRIWAVHGGSIEDKNELFPNYLLYWETIKWCAAHGFKTLDLLGIANETRIEEVEDPIRSMGGIYNFKRRFGAQLIRSVGTWDRVYDPLKYQLYILMNKGMDMLESPFFEQTAYRVVNLFKK